MKKSYLNRIYDQLKEICTSKQIDLDNLIDNIQLDNIEAYYKLNNYVSDESFHFFNDEKEKMDYLREFFDNSVSDDVLKNLTDFSGNGFRLLFILLNYFLSKISKIEICTSSVEKERIEDLKNQLKQELLAN